MNIAAKKIYRDYILKGRRRRFVQYSISLTILALLGIPVFTYICCLAAGMDAELATVSNVFDSGFTLQYYTTGASSNVFQMVPHTDYVLPVYKGQWLPVFFNGDKMAVNMMPQIISMVILLGAVYYFLKALYFIYLKSSNRKNVEKLMTEGKVLLCEIDRIENKGRLFKDFVITLKHTDIYGKTHYFQTERYYFDPRVYLEGVNSMKVYADPMNYKLYLIEMPESFPFEPWHYYY